MHPCPANGEGTTVRVTTPTIAHRLRTRSTERYAPRLNWSSKGQALLTTWRLDCSPSHRRRRTHDEDRSRRHADRPRQLRPRADPHPRQHPAPRRAHRRPRAGLDGQRRSRANVDDLLGVTVRTRLGASLRAHRRRSAGEIRARRVASATCASATPSTSIIDVDGVPTVVRRDPAPRAGRRRCWSSSRSPTARARSPSPNTYLAVRSAVEELNRAATLDELYDTTARAVRELTGFDRVMVYRYDHDYNGEVVAEAKRDDLNSFLGLHYPASDIPAQARALYEKNWLRLISDVDYTPAPLVPSRRPDTGAAAGPHARHAAQRVADPSSSTCTTWACGASMSISLLRRRPAVGPDRLPPLRGPAPAALRRAGPRPSSSARRSRCAWWTSSRTTRLRERLAAQAVLAKLTAAAMDDGRRRSPTSLLGAPDLLDLVSADGVVVAIAGEYREFGLGATTGRRGCHRGLGESDRRGRREHRIPGRRRCPTSTSTPALPQARSHSTCPTGSTSCGSAARCCARSTGAAIRTTRRSPSAKATTSGSARASRSNGGARSCTCAASRGR